MIANMATAQGATGPPPGSTGVPLLGETLLFLRDPFGFITRGIEAHGPVFRSRLFGKNAIVMAGPEASGWWADASRLRRKGAAPGFLMRLFGGEIVLFLDGERHRSRKQQLLAAFTREAIVDYLPDMQRTIATALADLASRGEFALVPAARRLAIEVICRSVLGPDSDADLDAILADYETVFAGFTALPIGLPGTAYSRARAASEHLLARYRAAAERERRQPSGSALGRVLAARTEDGATITVEDACRELYHLVIAGLIVFAELVYLVARLDEFPEVRARVERELGEVAPDGEITLDAILRMPYLGQVVMETKRLTPVVPAAFAIARESFELGGYTVPEGWLVLWSPWHSCRIGGAFSVPERFDPDRFSPERAEHRRHEHAYVPQGAGKPEGHLCAGVEYSSVMMAVFTALLVRSYRVELPPQDRAYVWRRLPPVPKDGLRIRLQPR
jgi:retinoid hydroxylase